MNSILISYDLRKPGKDYQQVYDCIKRMGHWAKPLESLWIVKTSKNTTQVCDELRQHVDANDKLLVINVTGDAMSWFNMPTDVATWLKTS